MAWFLLERNYLVLFRYGMYIVFDIVALVWRDKGNAESCVLYLILPYFLVLFPDMISYIVCRVVFVLRLSRRLPLTLLKSTTKSWLWTLKTTREYAFELLLMVRLSMKSLISPPREWETRLPVTSLYNNFCVNWRVALDEENPKRSRPWYFS